MRTKNSKLNNLISSPSRWLNGSGPLADISISSRIRIARNIDGFQFTTKAKESELKEIISQVEVATKNSPSLKKAMFIKFNELSELDRVFLLERHLISHDFAVSKIERACLIDDTEQISIMINEEDHLRIQVMQSGLQLSNVWKLANKIDDELETTINYAYGHPWGYLACCPTNTGTGLRASVMVHLPALVFNKKIDKLLEGISRLGLAVRGLYGENTKIRSSFFQISNQTTLGQTEEEIVDNVERIAKQVVEHEQNARKTLLKNSRIEIEDNIWRAYAILKNARSITSEESRDCLSVVKLGVEIGIIKEVTSATINELFVLTRPAHIQKIIGADMKAGIRDIKRAELIRLKFNGRGVNV